MTLVLPVRTYAAIRLRAFFDAWAGLALGWTSTGLAGDPLRRVHQSDGADPRPELPYFSYTRMSGPTPALDGQDSLWIGEVPTSATLVVTAAIAGEATTFLINELRFSRVLGVGETTTDQRDALLAEIGESIEPVVCTASGAASILVTPEYPGDLQHVNEVEGCTATTVLAIREIQRGIRTWRYRVQLHAGSDASDSTSGWIDIDQCVDNLVTVLSSPQLTRITQALQVSKFGPRPSPQRASVNSGGRIEQRVFFDVNLSTIVRLVDAAAPIPIDSFAPPAIVLL